MSDMSTIDHARAALKAHLGNVGTSVRGMEREAGVAVGAVSKFLNGTKSSLELETAERLAKHIGLSLAEFFGEHKTAIDGPSSSPALAGEVPAEGGGRGHVRMLRAEQIFPSPLNPRKTTALDAASISDLARSVAANGILQNLTARPRPNPLTETPQVEIVMGERRWRAVVHAIEQGDLPPDFELPVVVRDLTDAELIELAMIENISRADMSPLEEAEGLAVLHDTARHAALGGGARDWTARLAKATGKTDRWVQKRVRLARELSDAGKTALAKGEISLQMALELSEVPHAAQGVALTAIAAKSWGWDNAEKVQQKLFESLPLASQAIFDMAQYDGGTIEKDGVVKLADPAQAERLQLAAIAAEIERRNAAGETVEEVKQSWNWHDAAEGEAGTTIVWRDRFAVTFTPGQVKYGRNEAEPDEVEIERLRLAQAQRKAARHAFLTQVAAHLRTDHATRLRLQIFNTITEAGYFPAPLSIAHEDRTAIVIDLGLDGEDWLAWNGYEHMITPAMTDQLNDALAAAGQSKLERIILNATLIVGPLDDHSMALAVEAERSLAAATGIPLPPELIAPPDEEKSDDDEGDEEEAA